MVIRMVKTKAKQIDESPIAFTSATGNERKPSLVWLKAAYQFHSFAYRDPRSAFSSAMGLPVVSPTTVLLGVASTLFCLDKANEAIGFLNAIHQCRVVVDPPKGVVFFRAFHQLRRYETDKYGPNPRMGMTDINQGTREYGLVDGKLTLYVGVPEEHVERVKLALINRDHIGTHDSLCSLAGEVETCEEPVEVVYLPPETWQKKLPNGSGFTVVTLSRFRRDHEVRPTVGKHWWMAGGEDTELVPYLIKGRFRGTTRGKIYVKS